LSPDEEELAEAAADVEEAGNEEAGAARAEADWDGAEDGGGGGGGGGVVRARLGAAPLDTCAPKEEKNQIGKQESVSALNLIK
jgi:hypothetical protein